MVQGGAGDLVCTQCPSSFVHNPPLRKPESIICGVNPKHGGRSWGGVDGAVGLNCGQINRQWKSKQGSKSKQCSPNCKTNDR